MSKQSAAAMEVAPAVQELDRRMPPPAHLTEFQSQLWVAITATKPSDWFLADTAELLASYVKHASQARVIDGQIDDFEPEWLQKTEGLDRYDKLLKCRERETRAMASLATKLRLTQQSRYTPKAAATQTKSGGAKKPWES